MLRKVFIVSLIGLFLIGAISCGGKTEPALTGGELTISKEDKAVSESTPTVPVKIAAGKIAFESSGYIHIIDPDGSNEQRLTKGRRPLWSPDGNKLLFANSGEGWGVINADGTGRIIIPPPEQPNLSNWYHYYQWSPTGEKYLIAVGSSPKPHGGIYVVNADGGNLVKLLEHEYGIAAAVFSPDGTKIAYLAAKEERSLDYDLFLMNADGTDRIKLIEQDIAIQFSPYYNLTWSPDGRKITYSSYSTLYVVEVDGTGIVDLGRSALPIWLPDSKNIAYLTDDGIYIIKPDGTGRKEIIKREMYNIIRWTSSPDGKKIAFPGEDGVYTVNIDGSNLTKIVIANGMSVHWAPR